MTADDKNCELKKIEVTDKYTEISCEYTYRSEGSNVTINKEMYLLNDKGDKRYAFVKAENIPVHPEKYYSKAAGEKLAFKLYFQKVDAGTPWVDIIERAGRPNYFNFYHVSLLKSRQPVQDVLAGTTIIIDSVTRQDVRLVSKVPDLLTEQEVKQVGKAFVNSWNNHNFKDLPSYATEDVTWVGGHGSISQGRDNMLRNYQSMHRAVMNTTAITEETMTVRFIAPTVAILNLSYKLGPYYAFDGVDHGNNKRENSREVRTMTIVKQNNKWLLTAMQVTLVLPEVAETKPATGTPYVSID